MPIPEPVARMVCLLSILVISYDVTMDKDHYSYNLWIKTATGCIVLKKEFWFIHFLLSLKADSAKFLLCRGLI